MSGTTTIARLTFHEARRRRMVLAALGMGLVFLALFAVGVMLIEPEIEHESVGEMQRRFGYHFLAMAGFYVVHFLTVMLAILGSANAVSGEIASHTIQTLVTKPLRRWEVLLGKWLGYAAILVAYVALLGGGILLVMRWLTGYAPPHAVEALLLIGLEALVLISLSLLGGTRLSSVANGVLLLMLYGLAFVGGWVGQIGAFLQSESAVRVGTVISLLIPVEALWRRAAFLMQEAFTSFLPITPFTGPAKPSLLIVAYAAAYCIGTLVLAMRSFSRRDL